MTSATGAARPPIRLIDSEADRLSDLALGAEDNMPDISALLLDEIERAEIVPAGGMPSDVVVMNAELDYLDEANGIRRTVQLVYPGEADVAAGRISVLTHAGAGLIGLSAGQSIRWPDRAGRERSLSILAVRQPESRLER